jgi:hypothetical protein
MTGKSFEDRDRAERREVGEKLYANTKDAYTAGGTLIATIDGNIVSLGTFTEGTFNITPEGRALASEQGLLPPEPELQHPEEPVFGVPDDPENPPEDALPSDVPVRDPEPHPSQPIAGAPDALSHRVSDPTGEDAVEPLVEGAPPITASTLPDMIFSQPPPPPTAEPKEGEEPPEPEEPLIIRRPIAESFASEGGGTPDNPIRPTGVRQAETPDPNKPPPPLPSQPDGGVPDEPPPAADAASRQPSVGQRVKDAVLGKDDKSSKPKGKTQGRQLKLDLHDEVKATSKAKTG